ncbi:MAG: hypothetical protein J0M34_00995 [Alphaproteobacteria bacterium]|nr:hypothetical protein [Alphaproteobacteria bacterium]
MTRSRLTAAERAEREQKRLMDSIRNELRRTLERDTQKLLSDARQQLTKELQSLVTKSARQNNASNTSNAFGSVGNLSRIVTSIVQLASRPRMSSSTNSVESARSQDAANQFRVSRGQLMADSYAELSDGEKNL